MKEIENFLNEKGQLTLFPAKRKKKLFVLIYLIQKFDQDKVYTEKEVNEVLNQWHTFSDPVTLRRELYDHRFLDRNKEGSQYGYNKNQVSFEDLLKRY